MSRRFSFFFVQVVGTKTYKEVLQLRRKWPSTRKIATAKKMWSLTRKLDDVATGTRPGRYFVWKLLLMVGLEGQQESGDTRLASVLKGTLVIFGQDLQADVGWWIRALREPYFVDGVSLYSRCFSHVQWDLQQRAAHRMLL